MPLISYSIVMKLLYGKMVRRGVVGRGVWLGVCDWEFDEWWGVDEVCGWW